MPYDHVLMIGFGGPERPEDIRPFLTEVTRGTRVPEARLQDVVHHYEAVGGRSPYNAYTRRLFAAMVERLRQEGIDAPCFLGMRNWHPFLRDTLDEIRGQGLTRGIGLILAPHRSEASFEKYVRAVEEANAASGASVTYDYLPPWHEHPLFIEAQADQVRQALERLPLAERASAHLLFTAHSIPREMAQRSRYAQEFESSSRLVAERLGCAAFSCAYQSRSGPPSQPWLEPDVAAAIRTLATAGVRQVVVVPVGFLCDNVEVLFDLDIEARGEAERAAIGFSRASTVMDHPRFVELLSRLVREQGGGTWSAGRTRSGRGSQR